MEIILAILIYSQILTSPGTYYQSYIDQLIVNNQAQIEAVQADEQQMLIVSEIYQPQVEHVIVINDLPSD